MKGDELIVNATLELIRVSNDTEASANERHLAKQAAIQAQYARRRHNGRKARLPYNKMPPGYFYCCDCGAVQFDLPEKRATRGPARMRCDDCLQLLTIRLAR